MTAEFLIIKIKFKIYKFFKKSRLPNLKEEFDDFSKIFLKKTNLFAISRNHALKVFQQKYPTAEDIFIKQNLFKVH